MKQCTVYWGSHGCELEKGHEGWCDCKCGNVPAQDGDVGAFPYYGPLTRFYGADAKERQEKFDAYWKAIIR